MFRFKYYGAFIALAFFVCFNIAAQNAQAQAVPNYFFTPSSGTFTPLFGATVQQAVIGDAYDDWYPLAPIGFNFTYDGTVYTQVSASTKGFMSFGKLANADSQNSLSSRGVEVRPLVAPLWDDTSVDFFTGSVSYLTTGTAPNRVFTMQWLNMDWVYQATTPVISYQVKLYETTNKVQFVYRQEIGNINNLPANFGASIGLAGTTPGSGNFLSLSDSGPNPTASSTIDTTNIGTKPATGQVYTFSPLAPTAASVSVAGRVKTPNGRGLTNAFVTLTDSNGGTHTARTTAFGYFRFGDVASGETYVIQVSSKLYRFTPQVLSVNQDIADLDLTTQYALKSLR